MAKIQLKAPLFATIFALAFNLFPATTAHGAPPATPIIASVVESTNAAFDAGTITVNWGAVPLATSYSAMLTKQSSLDTPTVIILPDATERQAVFRGLRGGTVYIVQVKAFTGVEASTWSSNTRTAIPKTFPKAPAKPTAVKGVGRATVSWTALLAEERGGYEVTSYIVSKVGTTTKVEASGTATSAIVTGLSGGSKNEFTVTAVTAAGATGSTSDKSDEITLDDVPSTPAAPTLETTANSGELKSSWNPPSTNNGSDLISYTVKLFKDGVDLALDKIVTKLSDTFESFTGLLSGKYTSKVFATNEIGDSGLSAASNEITIGASASAAPSASASPTSTSSPVPSPTASPSPSASASASPSASPSPTVAPAPPSGGGGGGGGGGFGSGGFGGGALPAAVVPLVSPSPLPSPKPSDIPSETPSAAPSAAPSTAPTGKPTAKPTSTIKPTAKPSAFPSPTALPKIPANSFVAPVQVTAATQKVTATANTITQTLKPNKSISIAVPSVKKGTAVTIRMRTPDGKLITVTSTKTTRSGTYTMPALSFKKPGKYSIVAKIGNTLKTITITVKK